MRLLFVFVFLLGLVSCGGRISGCETYKSECDCIKGYRNGSLELDDLLTKDYTDDEIGSDGGLPSGHICNGMIEDMEEGTSAFYDSLENYYKNIYDINQCDDTPFEIDSCDCFGCNFTINKDWRP